MWLCQELLSKLIKQLIFDTTLRCQKIRRFRSINNWLGRRFREWRVPWLRIITKILSLFMVLQVVKAQTVATMCRPLLPQRKKKMGIKFEWYSNLHWMVNVCVLRVNVTLQFVTAICRFFVDSPPCLHLSKWHLLEWPLGQLLALNSPTYLPCRVIPTPCWCGQCTDRACVL